MSKFIDIYEKQGILGKGAFSVVYKCMEKKTGNEFAAKIIKTAAMSVRELIKLEREARINRKVEHENIVQLHNTIQVSVEVFIISKLITLNYLVSTYHICYVFAFKRNWTQIIL